ncbi:MAG: hypothetical protein IJV13_10310 [Prevotella sp.]|nr:hypothetical protein [Prevotella sp.]
MSIDELFILLIRALPQKEDEDIWEMPNGNMTHYTMEELSDRIDEGEVQFERGEFVTHEQMMADLKEEFAWLK